jgi:hypothetical protein
MTTRQLEKLAAKIRRINDLHKVAPSYGWDRAPLRRRATNLSSLYLAAKRDLEERGAI